MSKRWLELSVGLMIVAGLAALVVLAICLAMPKITPLLPCFRMLQA